MADDNPTEQAQQKDQERAQAKADAPGLGSTENPQDLSTGGTSNVDSKIAHQESAPEELTRLVDEQEDQGYIGGRPDRDDREDYSQANPVVMNQGADTTDDDA